MKRLSHSPFAIRHWLFNSRGLLLIEVLVALVLLAVLGVTILRIQSGAIRQFHATQRRAEIAASVEKLLWDWSLAHEAVTLPGTGRFSEKIGWRRSVEPIRLDAGVLATQVELVVRDDSQSVPTELYRIAWLVPRRVPEVR
jgi:type II secretory pathway pseudopilin PulG